MNIRFLETFVWLTRLKSFRATAEKLNTTQPNISSRISSLEDNLKTTLYVRGAKEFQLTTAGRRVFEYAENIVDIFNQMRQEVSAADAEKAVLRVGVIELVTLSWFPELVQAIKSSEEIREVDFVTETSDNLIELLRKDEIDLAFIWGPSNEPNIVNDYICNYAINWLGNPAYFDGSDPIDVVDVAKLPIIPTRKGTSGHTVIQEYFASYGVESLPGSADRITMNAYSLTTATQLIRTGLGIMAMAPLMMADDLKSGKVTILPVKQPLPPAYLTACYKTPSARPFVTRLVDMSRQAATDFAQTVDPKHFWI